MSQETLIMVYYANFHSLMSYGIISWGNSPCSIHIFRLQKKIITITNSRNRGSCRNLFKNLNIFLLYHNIYSHCYPLSLLIGSYTVLIQISITKIPDMVPLFIKQYQICLYIKRFLSYGTHGF